VNMCGLKLATSSSKRAFWADETDECLFFQFPVELFVAEAKTHLNAELSSGKPWIFANVEMETNGPAERLLKLYESRTHRNDRERLGLASPRSFSLEERCETEETEGGGPKKVATRVLLEKPKQCGNGEEVTQRTWCLNDELKKVLEFTCENVRELFVPVSAETAEFCETLASPGGWAKTKKPKISASLVASANGSSFSKLAGFNDEGDPNLEYLTFVPVSFDDEIFETNRLTAEMLVKGNGDEFRWPWKCPVSKGIPSPENVKNLYWRMRSYLEEMKSGFSCPKRPPKFE
jgi:hypothetical protein